LDDVRLGRDLNVAGRDIVLLPEAPPRAIPPEPRAGIPPEPIEHLVGRDADLSELRRRLVHGRRVVVHGLGGVGKTQLALAYLNQHRDAYPDGRFWLRADQATALVADLASLAWRLGLPERELPEQELQIEAVLRWLREHERWLLVIDNLDQPVVDTMRHWLPSDLSGHMIITSRSPQGAVRLGLDPLPLEIASGFLLERTGQDDAVAARVIAEALGGLPLALDQAAAYLIENHWRSLAEYAQLLQSRMAELMREGKPEEYSLPVTTTWELSFQRIEEEQPAAADLLRLCAFFAPDDIPITALRIAASELPERLREVLEDEIGCDRAVGALRTYSLVGRQGDGLQMHRLVQWVARELLESEQRSAWLAAAIRLLRVAFPERVRDPEQWPLCARLVPHTQTVNALVGHSELEPEAMCWLLDRVASYLQTRGEYAPARPLFERALAISEQVLGPDHPTTASILNNLAGLVQAQGELGAARSLFERARVICESALGPDHPGTAATLNNLARLLQVQGDVAAARPLYERALAIQEQVLGPDHPDTLTTLNNLALMLRVQGELPAARPLYERALAIQEQVLGPDHPDTATTLNNLATLLRAQGDLADARRLYERALAIQEQVLGPDHPDTAATLNNLASVLQAQGEPGAARPLYERALGICERVLGPNHPDTANSLNSLASVLRAQGELTAARAMFERALATCEQLLGPDHPGTAATLNNLASLLRAQGELTAARTLFERVLTICDRVHGQNHPDTAISLSNLAELLRAQGEEAAARPLHERALAIREKVLGPDHPHTASSLYNLAQLLLAQGDPAVARPLFERALAIWEKALGPDHPYTAASRGALESLPLPSNE
jgi:tetratricopeptide (TPR) repeat protein